MTAPTRVDPVFKFAEDMRSAGYRTSDDNLVTTLYLIKELAGKEKGLSGGVLDGPPGTGKTFAAECLAQVLEANMVRLQFTTGVGREMLMDDLHLPNILKAWSENSEFVLDEDNMWLPGVLVQAIESSHKQPTILLLDELDKAKPATDAFLLEFLQLGGLASPMRSEKNRLLLADRKNLIVLITKNDERTLSEPLMRRLRVVRLGWPPPELEIRLLVRFSRDFARENGLKKYLNGAPQELCKTLVTFANRLRKAEMHLKKVPSTPELAAAVYEMMLCPGPKARRGFIAWRTLFKYPDDYQAVQSDVKDEQGNPLFPEKLDGLAATFAQFE